MKCIGIDKRDPAYRHFYYDDETALQSNPPKYKVTYTDDETDVDYIDCNQVVKIKTIKEEVVESPQEQVLTVTENQNGVLVEDDSAGNSVTIEKPKRKKAESKKETTKEPQKRGRKKKILDDVITNPSTPNNLSAIDFLRVFHLFLLGLFRLMLQHRPCQEYGPPYDQDGKHLNQLVFHRYQQI